MTEMIQEFDVDKYGLLQWTTENGLPQNNVHSITQTKDGNLWLGTFDGLAKFDGNKFTEYNPGTRPKMTSSAINRIDIDSKGVLWVVSETQIFNIQADTIKVIKHLANKSPLMFLTCNNENILFWDYKTIYLFDSDSLKKIFVSEHMIRDVKVDFNNNIFILKEEDKNKNFELIKLTKKSKKTLFKNSDVRSIYFGKNSEIIACVNNKGTIEHYSFKKHNPVKLNVNQWLASNIVKNAYYKNNNKYYASSNSALLSENGKNIAISSEDLEASNHIMFVDQENFVWFGTNLDGLLMLYPRYVKTIEKLDEEITIGSNFVLKLKSNNLLVDGKNGSLVKYDLDKNKSTVLFENIFPWSCIVDSNETIWASSVIGPMAYIKKNGEKKKFRHKNYPINGVYSLFIDSKNKFWCGTKLGPGIKPYNSEEYRLIKDHHKLAPCYQFYEDDKNKIWMCSGSGLGIYHNGSLKVLTKKDGLPTNDIRTIYQDNSGTYWVGTSKFGLLRIKDDEIFHFPYKDDRINPNVWSIVEDDFGYLWMTSNQGLYRTSLKELNNYANGNSPTFSSFKFTYLDGLVNPEFNSRTQNKGFKDEDGKIWFSSIAGPTVIDPSIVKKRELPYNLKIESIYIDDNPITLSNKVILNPEQNKVKVHWSIPCFYQTENMKFKVFLRGRHDKWLDMDNSRSIIFNNLPKGTYEFNVKLIGSDKLAQFTLVIEEYFWESNWFKYLLVFLITSLILVTIFLLQRSRLKNKRAKKKIEQKLVELELKAMESQLNPHFIFNCLSSIQALYLKGDMNAGNHYMSAFSDLLRIIIEHMRVPTVSIEEEVKMLHRYIELEQLSFDDKFEYEIIVDQTIIPSNDKIPSVVLHTIVENAIKHGLKSIIGTRSPHLKITFLRKNNTIIVNVFDNGLGFSNSRKNKKTHTSRGLELIEERITLLNSYNKIKTEMTFKDLEQDGIISGCLVRLSFPVKYEKII